MADDQNLTLSRLLMENYGQGYRNPVAEGDAVDYDTRNVLSNMLAKDARPSSSFRGALDSMRELVASWTKQAPPGQEPLTNLAKAGAGMALGFPLAAAHHTFNWLDATRDPNAVPGPLSNSQEYASILAGPAGGPLAIALERRHLDPDRFFSKSSNQLAMNSTPIHPPLRKGDELTFPDWIYDQPAWRDDYVMDPAQFHDEFMGRYPQASRETLEHEMRKYYDVMRRRQLNK